MDVSHFLSQVLGIVLLTMGLGFAIQPQHYQTVFHEIMSKPGLKFISGIIPLIAGTLMILTLRNWDDGWNIFIGVLAWAIFLKGVLRIALPGHSDKISMKFIERPETLRFSIGLSILFGLALCYHGFFE